METDKDGRKYRLVYGTKNSKGETRYYKYYLDKGKIPEDYWTDINSLQSGVRERLGYPTQKPQALLERIISASSNESDVVLDPFCGCGTTVVAAAKLNRKFIGIDISPYAISIIKSKRLDPMNVDANVEGIPKDIMGAQIMAQSQP
ncbi:MAG: site-specific DNA-methyltransferase, partial [Chloroflexi bacterium]|nr:site-specific DNA-methyltransferase [Chloroflexota bacterium]